MRLISWNVNGRYGPALTRQIAAVRDRRPDVVALQEVRAESLPAWRDGLKHAGLAHVRDSSDLLGRPSLSGREYRRIYFNLVASRWPLRRLPEMRLEFPERYLAATVGRDGAEFELHTAHLPPSSTRGLVKVEMFEALHNRLAAPFDRPRIFCGDLNTPRVEHEDGTVEPLGSWAAATTRRSRRRAARGPRGPADAPPHVSWRSDPLVSRRAPGGYRATSRPRTASGARTLAHRARRAPIA